jgi:hypothetical protein
MLTSTHVSRWNHISQVRLKYHSEIVAFEARVVSDAPQLGEVFQLDRSQSWLRGRVTGTAAEVAKTMKNIVDFIHS